MATFATDSLDEGSTISSNPDGESVSAIKPRSEHLKNASSVTNPHSESEDLEEVTRRPSPPKKKRTKVSGDAKGKDIATKRPRKASKTPKPPQEKE